MLFVHLNPVKQLGELEILLFFTELMLIPHLCVSMVTFPCPDLKRSSESSDNLIPRFSQFDHVLTSCGTEGPTSSLIPEAVSHLFEMCVLGVSSGNWLREAELSSSARAWLHPAWVNRSGSVQSQEMDSVSMAIQSKTINRIGSQVAPHGQDLTKTTSTQP